MTGTSSRGAEFRSKYRTIVADPPWPIDDFPPNRNGRGSQYVTGKPRPYAVMATEAIASLPVFNLAEDEAHLYLWTINAYIEDAYKIARGWGFRPVTLLTWCKTPRGIWMGGAFTHTTEFVVFAKRGTLAPRSKHDSTWFAFKRRSHSAKPEAFLDLVESVSPGPYLELFARRQRLGWDTWGDEALEHIQIGVA